jgi:hypothetical protein
LIQVLTPDSENEKMNTKSYYRWIEKVLYCSTYFRNDVAWKYVEQIKPLKPSEVTVLEGSALIEKVIKPFWKDLEAENFDGAFMIKLARQRENISVKYKRISLKKQRSNINVNKKRFKNRIKSPQSQRRVKTILSLLYIPRPFQRYHYVKIGWWEPGVLGRQSEKYSYIG